MKKLILIRHGETDYTLQGRYCGHEDIALNSTGIGQAKRLRAALKGIKIDRVYSSPLKRGLETAQIIFPGKVIIKRKGLREIEFGRFSGLTFEEAAKLYPGVFKTWLNNPKDAKIPAGESVIVFAKRVRESFKRIFEKESGKTVALVSHGGPIRVILLKILGDDLERFWTLEQDTTALNVIEFKKGRPRILKLNDTSHLK